MEEQKESLSEKIGKEFNLRKKKDDVEHGEKIICGYFNNQILSSRKSTRKTST